VVAAYNVAWQGAASYQAIDPVRSAALATYAMDLIPKVLEAAGEFRSAALHVAEDSFDDAAKSYYDAVLECVRKATAADVTKAFDVVARKTDELRRTLAELGRARERALAEIGRPAAA